MKRRLALLLSTTVAVVGAGGALAPAPAQALNITKPICTLAGLVSKIAGTACSVASHAGSALQAGKQLLGGHLGGALETLSGASTAAKALTAGAVVATIVAWVTGGARWVLDQTAQVVATTTRPQLTSTWFSATYWRMTAIAALLTVPFLFAAAIQAVLRADGTLLARSALGYLPLGLLAAAIAAPVTMLLLSASDELSALISGATAAAPATALTRLGLDSSLLSAIGHSTFIVFFVALLTVAATITLWVELLIRSAAVYVVVLMLPLFFAAMVWPARRVWAVRAIELLVALILAKFVIVAVLSLGGSALGHASGGPSVTRSLAGVTLILLAALSPWALLRLLPLQELTAGLEGLHAPLRNVPIGGAEEGVEHGDEITSVIAQRLREHTTSTSAEPTAARVSVSRLGGDDPPDGDGAGGGAPAGGTPGGGAPEPPGGGSNGTTVPRDGATPPETALPAVPPPWDFEPGDTIVLGPEAVDAGGLPELGDLLHPPGDDEDDTR